MENTDKKYKTALVFVLICSAAAALAVVVSGAKYGPGTTHDSAAYMYAAQSVRSGEGFQYFGYPSPFIQWPPLYPLLLALGELAGLSSRLSSTIINSLAFALTVFIAGKWMLHTFRNVILSIGGTLLLLLSVPLLQVSGYLWTEILFVLFFLLLYINLERFFRYGNYGSLALAALFSALACIDRYAGVTIVATACLCLLFSKKGILNGIMNAAFYGVISSIPMGAWIVRNYTVSGTLLGVRLPSTYTLRQNIKRTLESIYTWVQPDKLLSQHIGASSLSAVKLFTILVPVLIIAAFVIFMIRRLFIFLSAGKLSEGLKNTGLKGENTGRADGTLFPIAFFTMFSVIYIVYLIASATSVAFEPINSRYLIPVYLPMVLSVLAAADLLFSRMKIDAKVTGFSLGLLIILFLVYPAANTAATVLDSWQNGAGGYAAASWREKNGFLKYMQKSGQYTYYSNNADVVYVMSGIRTYSPPKKSGPYMYGLEQFKAAVDRDENSIIIWFDNAVPQTLYSLEELSMIYKMKEIGYFDYGKIYQITK